MLKDDRIRLQHMLDAAREAGGFSEGQTRASLDSNRMLALSLVRDIEIIGEAASRISEEYQSAHPEVPWRNLVAMRNRLIHAYFDIDLDRVWDTVTEDVPPLIATLEALLASEEN
jgi:uncharacterized protein with HEPN domain